MVRYWCTCRRARHGILLVLVRTTDLREELEELGVDGDMGAALLLASASVRWFGDFSSLRHLGELREMEEEGS